MSADLKTLHALVVDRDRNLREIIRDVLHDFGLSRAHVHQAANGKEALEFLEIRSVDFIITGWRMSPVDGLAMTRKLRDPETTPAPGIPVIFCCSTLNKTVLGQARSAGVNEVILKPISTQAIKSRVTAVLERPRPIITLTTYIGPDRRRERGPWDGKERRSEDNYWVID
jgi:CheY-like chemotaxis protein